MYLVAERCCSVGPPQRRAFCPFGKEVFGLRKFFGFLGSGIELVYVEFVKGIYAEPALRLNAEWFAEVIVLDEIKTAPVFVVVGVDVGTCAGLCSSAAVAVKVDGEDGIGLMIGSFYADHFDGESAAVTVFAWHADDFFMAVGRVKAEHLVSLVFVVDCSHFFIDEREDCFLPFYDSGHKKLRTNKKDRYGPVNR